MIPRRDSIVPVIELDRVSRTFTPTPGVEVTALQEISLRIYQGEFVAIVGRSASGKTTLMNILGCLDRGTKGKYLLMGRDVSALNADELADLRSHFFGFVFQNYNLISTATARENIEVPGIYSGLSRTERFIRSKRLLVTMGIEDCAERLPLQMSGGQQQRTAIARALLNGGQIILADEPTGALDSQTGREVIGELKRMSEAGITVILITHDPRCAELADRRVEIFDGSIHNDSVVSAQKDIRPYSELGSLFKFRKRRMGFFSGLVEMSRTAGRSLRSNLLRTSLTLLGVFIGVSSVVTLMVLGEGTRKEVMNSVYEAGAGAMSVQANTRRKEPPIELTLDDVRAVETGILGIRFILPETRIRSRIRHGARDVISTVSGTFSTLPEVRNWRLAKGAFFSQRDGNSYEPVAVIGHEVWGHLFEHSDEVLGKSLTIGKQVYKVIGVLAEKGGPWGAELDRIVFLPLKTANARLTGRWSIDTLTIMVTDPEGLERTAEEVKSLLERWHGQDSIDVTLNTALLEAGSEVLQAFTLFLAAIAGISLLVGGVGIMNMMLTAVTERIREIGIRMAVGARRFDIQMQFLIESIVVSVVGATAGLVIGLLVGNLLFVLLAKGEGVLTVWPILLAFSSAVVTGLVFGYAPARRAAQLDPAHALSLE